MAQFASPVDTTQPYIPLTPAGSLGKLVGVPKYFATLAALNAAISAENTNIANGSALWADGEPLAVVKGSTYTWNASAGTATVVAGGSLYFNVKSYGALGNSNGTAGNGADDTSAINAAIAAASAAGGVVYFPQGTYRSTSASIAITSSNVHVLGDGMGCSKLFFDSTYTTNGTFGRLLFDGGATSGTIKNVSARLITVFNVPGVLGSPVPGSSSDGYDGSNCAITFRGCQNFLLANTDSYNSPNYGISVLRSSDGLVTGNFSHDHNADFFHVQDGCTRVKIIGNTGYNNQDDCCAVGYEGQQCTDIVIQGNTFFNSGGGIALYAPIDGCLVADNVVDSTWLCGVKVTPASQLGGSYNYINNVVIDGNIIKNAGNTTSPQQRAQGTSVGIAIGFTNGAVNRIRVSNNSLFNSLNGHIWAIPASGGTVNTLQISGNNCSGVSAVGGRGNSTTGTGVSSPSPFNAAYPGIWIGGVSDSALVSENTLVGAYHWGILADTSVPSTGMIRIVDNLMTGINSGNLAGAPGVNITSGKGATSGNLISSSPNVTVAESITTNVYTAAGTVFATAAAMVLAADNFTRANVAPAVGALGNTSTGTKTWVGSAAGITANSAYFSVGSFPGASIDCGASDVDVSITVALNGNAARLICRTTNTPSTSPAVNFDTNYGVYYYDGTNVTYFNTGTFASVTTGTHVLRLVVKGNNVTGYLDGTQIANGTYSAGLPTTTYVGFQESSNSAAGTRYTAFTVSTAP